MRCKSPPSGNRIPATDECTIPQSPNRSCPAAFASRRSKLGCAFSEENRGVDRDSAGGIERAGATRIAHKKEVEWKITTIAARRRHAGDRIFFARPCRHDVRCASRALAACDRRHAIRADSRAGTPMAAARRHCEPLYRHIRIRMDVIAITPRGARSSIDTMPPPHPSCRRARLSLRLTRAGRTSCAPNRAAQRSGSTRSARRRRSVRASTSRNAGSSSRYRFASRRGSRQSRYSHSSPAICIQRGDRRTRPT